MVSFTLSGNYTDLYEITMGEVYFVEGRDGIPACFDYFFRKIPAKGGYVLFAGLGDLLDALENLRFTAEDIAFLKELKFDPRYLAFLERFRFRGTVHSVHEGEVIFPGSPVVRVEGTLFETQLVETMLLNLLNFESLIATKASRIRYVAGDRVLSDFGLRRAHGPAAVLASKAAIIGGFDSTSNVFAAQRYGIKVSGTMAHSFVESYDSEPEAFRAFARDQPDNCTFLADTYDTLKSGIPHAITVAKEMEARGQRASGVRLDSGDLAYLARQARRMLDEAGLSYMKIVVSNQLDEHVIKSLLDQGAPIDVFGVGTHLVTGQPDAALDGVYKLSMSGGEPRLKLSDSLQKVTLPGVKQVLRAVDEKGGFIGADAIILADEPKPDVMYHPSEPDRSFSMAHFRSEPLLHPVMENGKRLEPATDLKKIAAYATGRLALLPAEYKRFENPHTYKVGISSRLLDLRETLRKQHKETTDESPVIDRHSK
jgi:nicotinate phosphoribosyltransferase